MTDQNTQYRWTDEQRQAYLAEATGLVGSVAVQLGGFLEEEAAARIARDYLKLLEEYTVYETSVFTELLLRSLQAAKVPGVAVAPEDLAEQDAEDFEAFKAAQGS